MKKWSNDLTDNLPEENFTSSQYHVGRYSYIAYLAFDNHTENDGCTGFQMDLYENKDWLKIDFTKEVAPSKITLQANTSLALPKKIKISMSNDDKNYVYIDTIDNIINKDIKRYDYEYKKPHKKYRYLKIEFLEQYNSNLMEINQIEFFEELILRKYLLEQNNKYYSIKEGFYTNSQYQELDITENMGKDIKSKITWNKNNLSNDIFKQYGFDDISDICKEITSFEQQGERKDIDDGQLLEFSLNNEFKDINIE